MGYFSKNYEKSCLKVYAVKAFMSSVAGATAIRQPKLAKGH